MTIEFEEAYGKETKDWGEALEEQTDIHRAQVCLTVLEVIGNIPGNISNYNNAEKREIIASTKELMAELGTDGLEKMVEELKEKKNDEHRKRHNRRDLDS